jgi:hypothetical protein
MLEPPLRFISTAIGEVGAIGMTCLLALHAADRNMAEDELMAIVHVESVATLRRHLNFCAMHEYASMVRKSIKSSSLWHITDLGRSIVLKVISLLGLPSASTGDNAATAQPRLIAAPLPPEATEKNFFSALSSSSSSVINQASNFDLDLEEEETGVKKISTELAEAARVSAVTRWCDLKGVTGEKRARVLADRWCTVERLSAWLEEMRHRGEINLIKFRNKYGPLNYAITCCLNHDDPPDRYAEYKAHSAANVEREESEDAPEIEEAEPPVVADSAEPEKISAPRRLSPGEFQIALRTAVQQRNVEWSNFYGEYINITRIDGDTLVISIQRCVETTFNQVLPTLLSLAQGIDADITAIEFRIY